MATQEFINKRIEGAKANIEKLEKKLVRINKAKESNWENNPYYYSEYDITYTTRELEAAKASLAKYEAELATTIEKDNSRDVAIILEFLEGWKKRALKAYTELIDAYKEEYKKIRELGDYTNRLTCKDWDDPAEVQKYREASKEAKDKYHEAYTELDGKIYGRKRVSGVRPDGKSYSGYVDVPAPYAPLKDYIDDLYYHTEDTIEKIKKDLNKEANKKYDNMIEKVNEYCGQVTDASNLHIDARGGINGIITGTRGKAKVETIFAGGYNIQILHLRTLIHPIKEK